MFCKNCGAQMNDNQEICVQCGVKKGTGNKFCGNCGKEVNENADVCLSCGMSTKKNAANANYLNGQDKVIIALVCFFLGGIGIHNFILGETKKGVVKIVFAFLCGISAILALIDFVKILMGTYVVDPNKAF